MVNVPLQLSDPLALLSFGPFNPQVPTNSVPHMFSSMSTCFKYQSVPILSDFYFASQPPHAQMQIVGETNEAKPSKPSNFFHTWQARNTCLQQHKKKQPVCATIFVSGICHFKIVFTLKQRVSIAK